MKNKIPPIVFFLLFFILMLFLALVMETKDPFNRKIFSIKIEKGLSAREVSSFLESRKLIKSALSFDLLTVLLRAQNKIQSGEYLLSPSMSNLKILRILRQGDTAPEQLVKITFPEGLSIYKMGEKLKEEKITIGEDFKNLVDYPKINELAQEFAFLKEVKTKSLEGFLFPDTYLIEMKTSKARLVHLMLKRFDKEVMSFWRKAKKDTSYSLFEIITLASIIQKEAALKEEMPIVSSVFRNRLNIHMKLDACTTVKYALEHPTKIVYYDQLKYDSPYNTYIYAGFPPGPICNPGLDAIRAAVYPAETAYLYFVANKDGSHHFSKSLEEHNQARKTIPTR